MKKLLSSVLLAAITVITSCSTTTDCCLEPSTLLGIWQLFEYGYSPGGGYITEDVPDSPLKYIELSEDNQFESNMDGFDGYHFFGLTKDSLSESTIFSLYINDPSKTNEVSQQNYNIERTSEGYLKLHYRFCIEGCHMAFRPYLRVE